MRLLYIITQGEIGGAQKNVYDTVRYLSKDNNYICVSTGAQVKESDKWLFDELKRNEFLNSNLHIFGNLKREISLVADIKAFFEIYKYVKKNRFHIVHLHSTKAGIIGSIASKLAGARVVYTVHGFVFQEPIIFLKRIFYILAEFTASFFIDNYICVSKKDIVIGKKFLIIRKNKGTVIYNGIETNTEYFLDKQKSRNFILEKSKTISEPKFIIGVVANLYRTKGIEYLIDAAKYITDKYKESVLFVVFGDGELRTELEDKIQKLGLQNSFKLLGHVNNASKYLKGLDLITLPSVKEGLPYIIIESSLANIPIIASGVGGVIEMAELVNIETVKPKDSMDLSKKIDLFFSNKKVFQNNTGFNDIFSIDKMIKSIQKIYISSYDINLYDYKSDLRFLITIPALNEELVIESTIRKVIDYLETNFGNQFLKNQIRICIAINGSTDRTKEIVTKLEKEFKCLSYKDFKIPGRGNALYNTWKDADEDVFLYTDSDLAYSIEDIGNTINYYLSKGGYDLVVASRRIKGSYVVRHPLRRFITEFYNVLIKSLFFNSFTDAQAGHKSIKKVVYMDLNEKLKNYPGWFFDTALLLYAEKRKFKIKDQKITCIDNRQWRLRLFYTIAYFTNNLIKLRIKTLFFGFK